MKLVFSKSAITKMQAVAIIVIIVVVAIGGAYYYTTLPGPEATPTPTPPGPTPTPGPSPTPGPTATPGPTPIPPTDLNTLVVASYWEPLSLDPCHSLSGALSCITRNVYEGLVRFNGSGTTENDIIPSLATAWTLSTDGTVYTFTLRQGVKFQDGTPFNASAAKFGIERMLAYGGGPAGYFGQIDHVDVVDNYTIDLVLSEPSATVLKHLATFFGYVFVSPTAVAAHNSTEDPLAKTWFTDHMVGTGPYQLVEWVRETRIVITKFDDYWGGWEGKHVTNARFLRVAEASTQKLMITKGEIDVAENIDIIDQLALNYTPGIELVLSEKYSSGFYGLFCVAEGKPLANVNLRRAILYAVNWDVYWQSIVMGLGQRMLSMFGSFQEPYWTDDFAYYRNVTKATELLAAEGYGPSNPLQLTGTYPTGNEFRRKVFEQLRTDLLEVNIELTLTPQVTTVTFGQVAAGENPFDIYDQGLYGCSDPDYALSNLFPSWMQPPASWNLGRYNNTEYDALILAERGETNVTARIEIFYRLQEIGMQEDPACIPFLEMPEEMSRVQRDWVKGRYYNPAMWRSIEVYKIWKEV